ncbi:MAG: hypothetical protein P4L35_19510 [Ignavibacteriaceae bacterium]|nr:hypothetical protein [Ignavibacteriaceae bacterium]
MDSKRQKEFEVLEKEYKDFISHHITDETKIYSYPDVAGIPGYPVFWDYRFIVQSGNQTWLFIYGSSSD